VRIHENRLILLGSIFDNRTMPILRLTVVLVTALAATLLWDSPILLPFKLLVVLVHEIWHALVSLLAGASVQEIALNLEENGETVVNGIGSPFAFALAVSAGYLGSALTAAAMLNRGLAADLERFTLFIFILILAYMTHLFAPAMGIAYYTGFGWSAVLVVPLLFGREPSAYTLKILGTLFIWYCLYDLYDFSDGIERSDAGAFAAYIVRKSGIGSVEPLARGIAIVWALLVVGVIYTVLRPVLFRAGNPAPQAGPSIPDGIPAPVLGTSSSANPNVTAPVTPPATTPIVANLASPAPVIPVAKSPGLPSDAELLEIERMLARAMGGK
jgi:hypothetical protein